MTDPRDTSKASPTLDTSVVAPQTATGADGAALASVPSDGFLREGTTVGSYIIQRWIATGGGGSVYEAVHGLLGRRVAIKVLHPSMADSLEMVARFIREAKAVNTIGHPNIIDIFEFGRLGDGRPFHVMEYFDGDGLHRYVQDHGRLTLGEAVGILEAVGAAVQAAHDRGVLHRDLKPSNVLAAREGDRFRVKLLDFGIAKLQEPEPGEPLLTAVGRKLGTPISMAPEQARAAGVDHRADIYALGVFLFYLLAARYPFESTDAAELELMHLRTPPPRLGDHAADCRVLDPIVARCMAKAPEHRFASVTDLVAAVREAVRPNRAAARASTTRAVAVFARAAPRGHVEENEEIAVAIADLCDRIAEVLGADFVYPPAATGSLLAVRALPAERDAEGVILRKVMTDLEGLCRDLASSSTAQDLAVRVSVAVGDVLERSGPRGREVLGGPLTRVEQWAGTAEVPHLNAAPDLAELTTMR